VAQASLKVFFFAGNSNKTSRELREGEGGPVPRSAETRNSTPTSATTKSEKKNPTTTRTKEKNNN
jgi:hypothetical protein